ncbi:hypothetical protein CNEO4_200215 [Clostridium neonatale]|nr:hypothetical protein CNEO4_200215 [Clostridium neonatale]
MKNENAIRQYLTLVRSGDNIIWLKLKYSINI